MNILEAFKAVDNGEIVRYIDENPDILGAEPIYICKTMVTVLGMKREIESIFHEKYFEVDTEREKYKTESPAVESLNLHSISSFPIDSLYSYFEVVSLDNMMSELRKAWEEHHKEKEY